MTRGKKTQPEHQQEQEAPPNARETRSHDNNAQPPVHYRIEKIDASTPEGRKERSFLSAVHNLSNKEESRMHAAQEFCRLHMERTGEQLDPQEIMSESAEHAKKTRAS